MKGLRSSFLRVYRHDVKLRDLRKTIFLDDFVVLLRNKSKTLIIQHFHTQDVILLD